MRIYHIYKSIFTLLKPIAKRMLEKRVKIGKEDPVRYVEKMGLPSCERPDGKLIWIHSVSVGESISSLTLIDSLQKSGYKVLITTSTITSANIMEQRLPKGVIHQYYPFDVDEWVKNFVNHWKPDLAIMIESELWLNMLENLKINNIPTLLLNARMSQKTINKWLALPFMAKSLFSYFSYISTQTHYYKNIIQRFAKCKVESIGNLKYTAPPPVVDKKQLKSLQDEIGDRPLWVVASTHKQDEKFIISAIEKLYKNNKNLLTIIVPRHPSRINELLHQFQNYKIAVRSKRDLINKDTEIYIADTIGEIGLFMTIGNICFIGGSTGGGYGGHNPLEPAKLKNVIIQGIDTANFAEITEQFNKNNAHIVVNSSDELYNQVDKLLKNKSVIKKYCDNAYKVAISHDELIDKLIKKIKEYV